MPGKNDVEQLLGILAQFDDESIRQAMARRPALAMAALGRMRLSDLAAWMTAFKFDTPPAYCHTEHQEERDLDGHLVGSVVVCEGDECPDGTRCSKLSIGKRKEIEVEINGVTRKVGVIEWCECAKHEGHCNLLVWFEYENGNPASPKFLHRQCLGSCEKDLEQCTDSVKWEDMHDSNGKLIGRRVRHFCSCK